MHLTELALPRHGICSSPYFNQGLDTCSLVPDWQTVLQLAAEGGHQQIRGTLHSPSLLVTASTIFRAVYLFGESSCLQQKETPYPRYECIGCCVGGQRNYRYTWLSLPTQQDPYKPVYRVCVGVFSSICLTVLAHKSPPFCFSSLQPPIYCSCLQPPFCCFDIICFHLHTGRRCTSAVRYEISVDNTRVPPRLKPFSPEVPAQKYSEAQAAVSEESPTQWHRLPCLCLTFLVPEGRCWDQTSTCP